MHVAGCPRGAEVLPVGRTESRVNCTADSISLGYSLPRDVRIPRGNNVFKASVSNCFPKSARVLADAPL